MAVKALPLQMVPYLWRAWWRKQAKRGAWQGANTTMVIKLAMFGLMGATLVIGRAMRQDVASIVGFIGINLVLGFILPNIDWRAHVGGLIVGAAVAAVFAFVPALVAGKNAPVGAGSAAASSSS